MKKTHLSIPIALAVMLLFGCVAAAVPSFVTARRSDGSELIEPYLDRVDIRADCTGFECARDAEGVYKLDVRLTIAKTEAEFYARIDSVRAEGDGVLAFVVEGADVSPDGMLLPVGADGEPEPLVLDLSVVVDGADIEAGQTMSVDLVIDLTSGVNAGNVTSVRRTVPLTLSVTEEEATDA